MRPPPLWVTGALATCWNIVKALFWSDPWWPVIVGIPIVLLLYLGRRWHWMERLDEPIARSVRDENDN